MQEQKERVILVALRKKGVPDWEVDDHLDELALLTDTAGATVVGRFTQRLTKPDPATFLGKGKAKPGTAARTVSSLMTTYIPLKYVTSRKSSTSKYSIDQV